MDEVEALGSEINTDLEMHHTVNEGKGPLGSWSLDLARHVGPGKPWLTAVAVLLLCERQLVRWKVAQASPHHSLVLLYRRTVELKGLFETKKPLYRYLVFFLM